MALSNAEKDRMVRFLTERLEASRLYDIRKTDRSHVWVKEKPEVRERPRKIVVMAHTHHMRTIDFDKELSRNSSNGWYTAHVFYQDGKTFFVPLTDTLKRSRALQKYNSEDDIEDMINLRKVEKRVLTSTRGWGKNSSNVVYYVPGDLNEEERIVAYRMRQVKIPRYEGEGYTLSRNYKIPKEVEAATAEEIAHFAFKKRDSRGIAAVRGETEFKDLCREIDPLLPHPDEPDQRLPGLFLTGLNPAQLIYLTSKLGSERLRNYAITPR